VAMPVEVEVMLYYHVFPDEHPRRNTKAVAEALVRFVHLDMLFWHTADRTHKITPRGRKWVEMILDTPFPVQSWEDPREVVAQTEPAISEPSNTEGGQAERG